MTRPSASVGATTMTKLLLALSGLTLAAIAVSGPARAVPPQTYDKCVVRCYYTTSARGVGTCLSYCAARYPTRTAIARPNGPKANPAPVTRRKLQR